LKLTIVALTLALFILGWAWVAREDRLKTTQVDALPRRLTIATPAPDAIIAGLPDLPPIPTMPRIRTRSS
jgi:hypothetical protein